jgi:hypothetical protein
MDDTLSRARHMLPVSERTYAEFQSFPAAEAMSGGAALEG